VTILFSEQNFVATAEHENGQCLNIVRLEDASLADLLNLAKELFDRTTLPDGSVFPVWHCLIVVFCWLWCLCKGLGHFSYTSKQHLARNKDMASDSFDIHPMSGNSRKGILEIATWFESVYENNPADLLATWTAVVAATENCSEGATTLNVTDAYKIPLYLLD
jgi:hypothetical protein